MIWVKARGLHDRLLSLMYSQTSWPQHMFRKKLYFIRDYVRSSLWVVPFVTIPLELLATRALHSLDGWLGWTFLGLGVSGANAMLNAIITATLSFVVFTFGSLLVALQIASGQMTPRIIATILVRDNVVRYTAGLFIFTLLFAVSAENRIQASVSQLVAFVAACLAVTCFGAFLYLIDYASRLLRPISIVGRVSAAGLSVIASCYPEVNSSEMESRLRTVRGRPARIVAHEGSSEIVLAANVTELMRLAEKANGVIELVPQVGDFVATDEPLFKLYGGAEVLEDWELRSEIAFGPERTLEQDPTFAFRIIVDIALKALSAAINDPTTAVIATDQLHRLLRSVGRRNLLTEELLGASGELRVICRTPNWEDFVHLAFTEIRLCGAHNIQIARRLRAMIENLIETLPDHRRPSLARERMLLDREIDRRFPNPEDQLLARVADSQGLGGAAILQGQGARNAAAP